MAYCKLVVFRPTGCFQLYHITHSVDNCAILCCLGETLSWRWLAWPWQDSFGGEEMYEFGRCPGHQCRTVQFLDRLKTLLLGQSIAGVNSICPNSDACAKAVILGIFWIYSLSEYTWSYTAQRPHRASCSLENLRLPNRVICVKIKNLACKLGACLFEKGFMESPYRFAQFPENILY